MRLAIFIALALTSCAVADQDDLDDELGETEQDSTTLWYTPITKEYFLPSAKIAAEVKKVFASEAEWVAFFGQPSPGIDFDKHLAIFFTPGTGLPAQQPAGYRTRLRGVSLSSTGRTLTIKTGVEYNGDCAWRSGRPFITATVARPAVLPEFKKFSRSDTERDCH